MAENKIKLGLSQAKPLAGKIVTALAPGCDRIEIAGSIRRQKPVVGDIEIVAIARRQAKLGSTINFLTSEQETESCLDLVLETLLAEKPHFRKHPGGGWGDRYKKLQIGLSGGGWITLDLFITTPPQWGLILAIRTGPAEFSRHIVTQGHKGGPLPPGFSVGGGSVLYLGQPVDTPEESDMFALLGYDYHPPEKRSIWRDWTRAVAEQASYA